MTAININSNKAHAALEKCRVLREYSLFIDAVRAHEKEEGGTAFILELEEQTVRAIAEE